ncbi:hypothetical protein [Ruania zhangjianzhongii]|nr:hypothetical protein [Ruania zhangjianzhongii]
MGEQTLVGADLDEIEALVPFSNRLELVMAGIGGIEQPVVPL